MPKARVLYAADIPDTVTACVNIYRRIIIFSRHLRLACEVERMQASGRCSGIVSDENLFFTITAEIHARSLANFYCQFADRHMNLKFMRRVSEREPAIRQFVIVKNKLMSVFNASVLLLIMNFVITLSK